MYQIGIDLYQVLVQTVLNSTDVVLARLILPGAVAGNFINIGDRSGHLLRFFVQCKSNFVEDGYLIYSVLSSDLLWIINLQTPLLHL